MTITPNDIRSVKLENKDIRNQEASDRKNEPAVSLKKGSNEVGLVQGINVNQPVVDQYLGIFRPSFVIMGVALSMGHLH